MYIYNYDNNMNNEMYTQYLIQTNNSFHIEVINWSLIAGLFLIFLGTDEIGKKYTEFGKNYNDFGKK